MKFNAMFWGIYFLCLCMGTRVVVILLSTILINFVYFISSLLCECVFIFVCRVRWYLFIAEALERDTMHAHSSGSRYQKDRSVRQARMWIDKNLQFMVNFRNQCNIGLIYVSTPMSFKTLLEDGIYGETGVCIMLRSFFL